MSSKKQFERANKKVKFSKHLTLFETWLIFFKALFEKSSVNVKTMFFDDLFSTSSENFPKFFFFDNVSFDNFFSNLERDFFLLFLVQFSILAENINFLGFPLFGQSFKNFWFPLSKLKNTRFIRLEENLQPQKCRKFQNFKFFSRI